MAFSFDLYFDFVSEINFEDEMINKVKRAANSDFLLIGGFKTLTLVLFEEKIKKFSKLRTFRNVAEDFVCRIEILENRVYLIDVKGKILSLLEFEKDIEQLKDSKNIS